VTYFWLTCAILAVVAAASVWFAFQSPDFVTGLVLIAAGAAVKAAVPAVTKRMKPDQEKAFRDCVRRGGEWDSFRKKCK